MGIFDFSAGQNLTTGNVAVDANDVVGGDKTTTTTISLNFETLKSFASPEEIKRVESVKSDKAALAEVLTNMTTKYGKQMIEWILGC